ncbi:hypothetical protein ES319_A01G165500v1, partial [Gossypium barbadense]
PAPVSLTDFIFSLLNSSPPSATAAAILDANTCCRVLYPELILLLENLASSLSAQFGLSKGDCALVFSHNNIYTSILYLSLFSLGVVISPINPAAKVPEIQHQIWLSKLERAVIEVKQSDVTTILYSSGTTGPVKGVALTHRNWIAYIVGGIRPVRMIQMVGYCTIPLFHAYGVVLNLRLMTSRECLVITGGNRRFDMRKMNSVIEEYRVSQLALAPPLVITMDRDAEVMDGYDLSSLEVVIYGGAHLSKSTKERLKNRLPKVQLAQSYELAETTGRVFVSLGPDETRIEGATGKLMANCEAKVVDPEIGYVDDEEATIAVLDREGWLRTGNLCYINNQGYLFFVDRIKELIKYKGYQVVAPTELEHLLNCHPDVVEAAVIPYVSHYKRIRRVIFIDSLPRNASGKVLRKELVIKLSTPTSKL